MEIALLILVFFILGKTTNSIDETESRVVAGSLLGIAYFFVWPFLYFYLQLLSLSETHIQLIYVSLLCISFLIIKALLTLKSVETTAIATLSLFFIVWIISSVYEVEVKDSLTDYAGYFDNHNVYVEKNLQIAGKKVDSPGKSYVVTIPVEWRGQSAEATGYSYYTYKTENGGKIEFRPKCFDRQLLAISDIVQGMSEIHSKEESSSSQCFHWRENGYACKVVIKNQAGDVNRVRWLGSRRALSRVFELDFVIEGGAYNLNVIDAVFASVVFGEITESRLNCAYSVEWF